MSEPHNPPENQPEAERLRARLAALDTLLESGDLTAEEHAVARRLAIFGSGEPSTHSESKPGQPAPPEDSSEPAPGVAGRRSRRGAYGMGAAAIALVALIAGVIFALSDGAPDKGGAAGTDLAYIAGNGRVKLLTSDGARTNGLKVEPAAGLTYDRNGTLWIAEGTASARGFVTHGCNLWSYAPLTRVATYEQGLTALRNDGLASSSYTSANLLCFPTTNEAGQLILPWHPLERNSSSSLVVRLATDGSLTALVDDTTPSTDAVNRESTWKPGEYFEKDEPETMGPTRVTLVRPDGSERVVWPLSFGLNVRQVVLSPDGRWVFARAGSSGCGTCTFDLYKTPADRPGASPTLLERSVQAIAGVPPADAANTERAEPSPNAAPAESRAVAAGLTTFEATCQGCHLAAGTEPGGVGPELGGRGLRAADIRAVIENGAGAMPGGLVSGADLTNVVDYVASIQ